MKKFAFLLFILSSLLLFSKSSYAQDYKPNYSVALGFKFGGYENGIAAKYFMTDLNSIEGFIGFRSGGVVFTGLYEFNVKVFDTQRFRVFYGFGAHLGGIGRGVYKRFNGDNEEYNSSQILLGADGVVGLE